MRDEFTAFIDRAKKFDSAAKYFYDNGVFDLSAFHVEQAFQLYLKFILGKELGYFPRTHSLTKLFMDLSRIDTSFSEFYNENELAIKNVEDAYILSRYLPRDYSAKEVKFMLDLLEKFKKRFEKWLSKD